MKLIRVFVIFYYVSLFVLYLHTYVSLLVFTYYLERVAQSQLHGMPEGQPDG
jgi:hypothetical protein